MVDLTLFGNKKRKETHRYIFIFCSALLIWVLQVSIFSRFIIFDSSPNILLLCTIYLGLTYGIQAGVIYGIVCSFLNVSVLYDHIFYFSLPLMGLLAGLLTRNLFSDELLFFILLCFFLTLPYEYLNGWQFSLDKSINLWDRYLMSSVYSAALNMLFSPFFYFMMNIVTKNLKLR